MTPEERKQRIRYLWFRVRCVYNMIRFFNMLRINKEQGDELREDHSPHAMMQDDGEEEESEHWCNKENTIVMWQIVMSFLHWLNLLITPIVMLWPELFPSPSALLWLIEVFFIINILLKCGIRKPKSYAIDNYDIFVEYLQSTLPIDVISTLPHFFSAMDNKFTFLRILRVYEIDML